MLSSVPTGTSGLGDEDALNELKGLAFAHKALGALLGERLLEAGERNLTVLEGRATVPSWAAAELLMSPGEVKGMMRAAKVARRLPALAEHYRSGRMSTLHMLTADTALGGFPEHQIPKAKASQFVDMISELAGTHCVEDEPACSHCPLRTVCPTGIEAKQVAAPMKKPR